MVPYLLEGLPVAVKVMGLVFALMFIGTIVWVWITCVVVRDTEKEVDFWISSIRKAAEERRKDDIQ